MIPVFADAGYWIALSSHSDALHSIAIEVTRSLGRRPIITSQMVLTEFLDGAAGQGIARRTAAWNYVEQLQAQTSLRIVPQTPELFAAALELYKRRQDKDWSLTDCASIFICQQEGITDVLAHDHHFVQAGFTALLRSA